MSPPSGSALASHESSSANGGDPLRMPDGALVAKRDAPVGGQAVLEGVMMRGISVWAVAVRHADKVKRRIRRRKEKDLRTEGIHISLPTLLRLKEMEKGTTSSFNPKR